jgi:hypothetical protein
LQGDLAAAATLVEQGRELAAQLGDAAARAQAMLASGFLEWRNGDLPGAVACFEQVLDTISAEGDIRSQLEARYGLALASGMLGDMARRFSRSPNPEASCGTGRIPCGTSGWWRGAKATPAGRPSWSSRACG